MNIYRQKILDHFKNPRNTGEILNADFCSQLDNPLCGDMIEAFLNVKDSKIKDIKFKTQGCAIAIAAMSMLSEKVKGMSVKQALALDQKDILNLLGISLSPARIKCGMLGLLAIKKCLTQTTGKQAR
ncbi:MAG: iron-sulfur cluster assembly scaffold protein [Candidatus Jacksonbacteria bacterium]